MRSVVSISYAGSIRRRNPGPTPGNILTLESNSIGQSLLMWCCFGVETIVRFRCCTSPIIHPHRSCSLCPGIAMVETSKTRKRCKSLPGFQIDFGLP